jgi:hypothetical protein
MPAKPPFSLEFNKLKCGTWEVDRYDDTETLYQRIQADVDAGRTGSSVFAESHHILHEVRALFGQNKLRFEMSISHPRSNRGRIDIDFDQIAGLDFTYEQTYSEKNGMSGANMTVQVSSPARCYIGKSFPAIGVGPNRGTLYQQLKRTPPKFEDEHTDFSEGGQIKISRTFTIYVGSAYRLNTMEEKLRQFSHPALIAAMAAGITSNTNFTAEEVQASLDRDALNKKSKKRSAPGNENDSGNTPAGVASTSGAPPKPRKPNPKLLEGLVQALPPRAGPWLKKCVQRWKLVAPFDPRVTEELWEEYYKERDALDRFNGKIESQENATPPAWVEEFQQPGLLPYGLVRNDFFQHEYVIYTKSIEEGLKTVISGCPQLTTEVENIADKVASGIYVLSGKTESKNGECRDFDAYLRLYSPYGLGTSVDFNFDWRFAPKRGHEHSSLENNIHIVSVWLTPRTAYDCTGEDYYTSTLICEDFQKYSRIQLFSMERYESGYYKRTFMGPSNLRYIEEVLFGQKNLLSDRKIFSLLIHAAMGVRIEQISNDMHALLRVSRRTWRLFAGETGDSNEGDVDSDNEGKKHCVSATVLIDDYSEAGL